MIGETWQCKDNPDYLYGDCKVPEQEWTDHETYVENRFTVGSLVWAKMAGWPSWPAMVDDDLDTGDFFWTEVRDGSWVATPSHYHVVFFEKKTVTRAWVRDSQLRRFPGTRIHTNIMNNNLQKAVEMAQEAAIVGLEDRRYKYCLAHRYKGHWSPVWPGGEAMVRQRKDPDTEEAMKESLEIVRE